MASKPKSDDKKTKSDDKKTKTTPVAKATPAARPTAKKVVNDPLAAARAEAVRNHRRGQ